MSCININCENNRKSPKLKIDNLENNIFLNGLGGSNLNERPDNPNPIPKFKTKYS